MAKAPHPPNARAMYQDRDYIDAAGQGRSHFETDEVVRLVEPACTRCICDGCPVGSDDGQQDRTFGHIIGEDLAEILARMDIGDIHENGPRAEQSDHIVVEAPRFAFRIRSPVADENNPTHPITARAPYQENKWAMLIAQFQSATLIPLNPAVLGGVAAERIYHYR